MEIGDRIKRERVAAGLTQAQLAGLIGVDKSAVAQWESAASRKGISTTNLLKVADVLAVPIERLTGDDGLDRLDISAPSEIELVRLFRRMTPESQDIHLRLFRTSVGIAETREAERDPPKSKRIAS